MNFSQQGTGVYVKASHLHAEASLVWMLAEMCVRGCCYHENGEQ